MYDDIGFTDEFVHEVAITDITGDEFDLVEDRFEIVWIASIGQFVDDRDPVVGLVFECVVNKVGSDEAGAAGDE